MTVWITTNCGKFFKRWECQTTWPPSWEAFMQVKKQQLELDRELWIGSKLRKECVKGVYCHPAYLTYMQSTSWKILGWMKHNLESRLPREISITSDMQITTSLWLKAKRTKEPSDESERGEWKAGLKLNFQKVNIMASSPITSWQIDGETMETVTDFILGGSKITADGDCSHEIKRCVLLGRNVMTNLDSIWNSRDITLPTKVHLVKASYGFSSGHVWMLELDCEENWVPKNWCFWTVNCGVGEDSWESLGLQGDPTYPS